MAEQLCGGSLRCFRIWYEPIGLSAADRTAANLIEELIPAFPTFAERTKIRLSCQARNRLGGTSQPRAPRMETLFDIICETQLPPRSWPQSRGHGVAADQRPHVLWVWSCCGSWSPAEHQRSWPTWNKSCPTAQLRGSIARAISAEMLPPSTADVAVLAASTTHFPAMRVVDLIPAPLTRNAGDSDQCRRIAINGSDRCRRAHGKQKYFCPNRLPASAWPWKSLAAGIWLSGSAVVFGVGLVRRLLF